MVFGWLFNIFFFFAKIKAKFYRFNTQIMCFFDSDVTEKHGNKWLDALSLRSDLARFLLWKRMKN